MGNFKKFIAALKYWNIRLQDPIRDENFQSRLIIQKLAHLIQSLGINMNYNFGLYKKGPYCPQLTNDYYNHPEFVLKLETTYQPTIEEIKIYNKISNIIFSHSLYQKHQADFLQAISTILFLKKNNSNLLDDDLFEYTKNEKPYLSDTIIIIALNIIKKLMFKREYLTDEIQKELDLWDKAED